MRNRLALFVAVLVVATASFAALAYNTEGDIRTWDGHLNRYGYSTDKQYGQILWSSTGCAITTPTTATKLACATHTTSGVTRGAVTVASGTTATITLGNRPGLYRATARCGSVTGVNSAVQSIQIWKKDGTAGTDAILANAGISRFTNASTALALYTAEVSSDFELSVADAALAGGNIMTVRVQSDTGNYTCKDGQFTVEKIAELSPPLPQ